jgi:hypothetical protein
MALKGAPDGSQFNLDTLFPIAESLVPTIFQQVCKGYGDSPQAYSLPVRTHTVTLANGVGTLPDEVLTVCKYGATIADPDDVAMAQTQTLVPFWNDFVQPRNNLQLQLTWWTIKGGTDFHLLQPQEEYDPASGFDGDIEYTSPSVVAIPASSGATLVAPDEIISDLQDALSKALMGQMKAAA